MERALQVLGGIYAVVLAAALAGSLVVLLGVFLRIERTLARVAHGLRQVEAHTAPLEGHVEGVTQGLTRVSEDLSAARSHLHQGDLHATALGRALGVEAGVGSGPGRGGAP